MAENLLRTISLFDDLDSVDLDSVTGMLEMRAIPKNSTVITQDEFGDGLYIIKSGKVAMTMQLPSDINVELARLSDGKFFGEIALLTDETAIASVTTLTDCEFLVLTCRYFDAMCITHADIAYRISQQVAALVGHRIRYRIDNIIQLLLDKEQKLSYEGLSVTLPKQLSKPSDVHKVPRLEQLQVITFFQDFSAQEIEEVITYCNPIHINKRSVLYHQGDNSNTCYIVLFGAAQQIVEYKHVNSKLTAKGPGTAIGVISFLDHKDRAVTTFIRDQAILCELTNKNAYALKKKNRMLWYKVHHQLVREQLTMMRLADIQMIRIATETVRVLDQNRFNELIKTRVE